jgi:murein DD-endopeptidase MepM/ murein hydrolase activator NlpD
MKQTLIITYFVCLPLHHLILTSAYGGRIHPITGKPAFHAGIDLRARSDTVFSIMDGIVLAAAYDVSLGIYIRLDHGGIQSVYGHLSQVFVTPGDTVYAGRPIALTGATGRVTGEHLHFAVFYRGRPLDPIGFLYRIIINSNHTENHE